MIATRNILFKLSTVPEIHTTEQSTIYTYLMFTNLLKNFKVWGNFEYRVLSPVAPIIISKELLNIKELYHVYRAQFELNS